MKTAETDFASPGEDDPIRALRAAADRAWSAEAAPFASARDLRAATLFLAEGFSDTRDFIDSLSYNLRSRWFVFAEETPDAAGTALDAQGLRDALERGRHDGSLGRTMSRLVRILAERGLSGALARRFRLDRLVEEARAAGHGTGLDALAAPKGRSSADKPVVRIVHHLGRTGGTLFNKCLLALPDTVVLSEIHPFGHAIRSPFEQADRWFHLFGEAEIDHIRGLRAIPFDEMIGLIAERAAAAGKALVIRDWSHVDFTPVELGLDPSFRLTTAMALADRFDIRQVATVRHPADQWLSMLDLYDHNGVDLWGHLDPFFEGVARFHEATGALPRFRYEDLVDAPLQVIEELAHGLALPFDDGFVEKVWGHETSISTANVGTRGVAMQGFGKLRRRPVKAIERMRLEESALYRRACTGGGYDPDAGWED